MFNIYLKNDFSRIIQKNGSLSYLNNQRILITGGLGLIGLYIVKFLLFLNEQNENCNIVIVLPVRNLEKARKRLGFHFLSPHLKIIVQDITNPLNDYGKIDTIIHAASPANGTEYIKNPVSVIKSNTIGTVNLLDYAKENATKNFIYLSTGDVTGEINKPLINESEYGPLDHTTLRSCYAESKRISETMCVAWAHQYNIRTLIIRPDHTYGPTIDLDHDNRVFADFIRNIINKENIKLKSDGSAIRTFCYLQDFMEGFLLVLEKGISGNVYNISNPISKISISDLANLLSIHFIDKSSNVYFQRRTTAYLENPIKLRPSLCIDKLVKLGYQPEVSILDGFKRTIHALSTL